MTPATAPMRLYGHDLSTPVHRVRLMLSLLMLTRDPARRWLPSDPVLQARVRAWLQRVEALPRFVVLQRPPVPDPL